MGGVLLLFVCILSCGCLSPLQEDNVIQVDILNKEMTPGTLGECIYRTEMLVNNTGTVDVLSVTIVIELYDPDAQRIAARESLEIGRMLAGESKDALSSLQTHCRENYTLRAYARY